MDIAEYGLTDVLVEFIKNKSLEGNLVFQQGSRTTDGTVVSYTPASGKNFVLLFASYQHFSANLDEIIVTLKNDTNTRESHTVTVPASSTNSELVKFNTFGDVLTGNGSKKYEISVSNVNSASLTIYGNICGYLEDT